MTSLKLTRITFWTSTSLIFLFEGLMPALTSNSELAIEGIRHLGYPDYFRRMLTAFKIAGALVLILPFIKGRIKDWAYAGFGFSMFSAFISYLAVDGPGAAAFFPLIVMVVLAASYTSYVRLRNFDAKTGKLKEGEVRLAGVKH